MDTARARAEAAFRRDATLEAVAFAAQRFLEEPDWERSIDAVLRRLGEATGVSRVYVYENEERDGEAVTVLRAQWVVDPSLSFVHEGTALGFHGLERWVTVLGRGDVIHGPVSRFPPSELATLQAHRVASIVLTPLSVESSWWGYVGFDDCFDERVWTQVEIDALRAFAGALAAAIARQRSEQRLREAEARFRQLVEQVPAVTYVDEQDQDTGEWRATYVSPQVERVLGVPPEEALVGTAGWAERVHPDDREAALAATEHHYRTGEPLSIEYRMIALDGSEVWIWDQSSIIEDVDGRRSSQGVLIDVSETRAARERLRVAEERFRVLVEHLPAVTYREDWEGRSEGFYISPQVERVFGYTAEGWTWTPAFWSDRIHPEDRERVLALDRETNRTHETYATEYRFRHADGSYVWIHDEATFVRSVGESGFWQGFMLDITQRKEAESALADAMAKYRAIVEQAPIAIYTQEIGAGGLSETTFVSRQHEQMLGWTPEEMAERPDLWRELLHPDDRALVLQLDAESNARGGRWTLEYRMRHRDGHYVWVRDEASLVLDEHGTPRLWQGYLIDITERKDAEERLERALAVEREAATRLRALDEMKNTFLQAVSHDLRTPLAAILGLAVTLERADIQLDADDMRDLARRIAGNARKLDRMVTDLLDLDRLARGIVEPKLHATDVGALVARVVADWGLASSRQVDVTTPTIVASVDVAKVERIVENLLANTARHTPSDARVWVRVEPAEDGLQIVVEDDGPGVPPEFREEVFEPFRQGPDAPEHSPGVGVGLALVSRFAELMGGRAWVEERPGGGASFRVYLPGDLTPSAASSAG